MRSCARAPLYYKHHIMRYSKSHKSETRALVLKEAAREIRAKGADGVAVAGIMARAGLTHGGFYAHFGSRDELIAEAIATMFSNSAGRFETLVAGREPADALAAYINFYLSSEHRDRRDRGCPLAALASEADRLAPPSRARFGAGVQSLTTKIAGLLARNGFEEPSAAPTLLAALVGALTLARSMDDPAQSDAILRDVRMSLLRQYGLEKLH